MTRGRTRPFRSVGPFLLSVHLGLIDERLRERRIGLAAKRSRLGPSLIRRRILWVIFTAAICPAMAATRHRPIHCGLIGSRCRLLRLRWRLWLRWFCLWLPKLRLLNLRLALRRLNRHLRQLRRRLMGCERGVNLRPRLTANSFGSGVCRACRNCPPAVDRARILEEWIGIRVAHDPHQLGRGVPPRLITQLSNHL